MLTSNFIKTSAVAAAVALNLAAFGSTLSFDTNSSWTILSGQTLGLSNNQALPTLTGADFSAAASGPNAFVLSGLAGGWVSDLPTDSSAKWIGVTSTGGSNSFNSYSGLYAYGFNFNSYGHDAILNVTFSVDDQFGDANNKGIFLDGAAVSPDSHSPVDWNGQITSASYNLGVVSGGPHELYFNVQNSGSGPSGMILTGNVTSTPAPAALGVFATGILGAFKRRKRS